MFDSVFAVVEKTFTPFDWFIVICVIGFGFRGFYRGIMKEVFTLGGAIVGMLLGRMLGPSVGQMFLQKDPTGGSISGMIGFALVFFMVMIASTALSFTTRKLVKLTGFGTVDRALGLILGVLIGFIIPGLFLYLIIYVHGSLKGSPVEHSILAPFDLSIMKVLSGIRLPQG